VAPCVRIQKVAQFIVVVLGAGCAKTAGVGWLRLTTTNNSDANVESGARHESGHIVIAATQGLPLRPEGLMIDPSGWGLACYHEASDESDSAREKNIRAVLAAFAVENRFREKRGYPARDYLDLTFNRDNVVARTLLGKLSSDYGRIEERLTQELDQLIERHWRAIEALATALLAKRWEPLKPLKSGGRWSEENETTAKYLSGEEVVRILVEHGTPAVCDPG